MNKCCVVCNKSTTEPSNFLLRCLHCHSCYHHRCHKPYVRDSELVALFRRYKLEKTTSSSAIIRWSCVSCAAKSEPNPSPAVPPPRSAPPAAPNRPSASPQNPIIILDSDDESDPPIAPQPTKFLPLKSRKSVTKSTNLPPPTATNHVQAAKPSSLPTTSSSTSKTRILETRRDTGIRIINDPFIEVLSSPPFRPPLRPHSSTSSSTLSAGLDNLHMSTVKPSPRPQQEEENEWDIEYVTPPAPPPIPLPSEPSVHIPMRPPPPPQRHVRIAQSLPPIAAIISNDDDDEDEEEEKELQDNEEDEDKDELEMDEIDPTPAPAPVLTLPALLPVWINHHFTPASSNTSRKPFSRRKKFTPQNLTAVNTANKTSPSAREAPSFFHSDLWIAEKKRALPEYPSGVS